MSSDEPCPKVAHPTAAGACGRPSHRRRSWLFRSAAPALARIASRTQCTRTRGKDRRVSSHLGARRPSPRALARLVSMRRMPPPAVPRTRRGWKAQSAAPGSSGAPGRAGSVVRGGLECSRLQAVGVRRRPPRRARAEHPSSWAGLAVSARRLDPGAIDRASAPPTEIGEHPGRCLASLRATSTTHSPAPPRSPGSLQQQLQQQLLLLSPMTAPSKDAQCAWVALCTKSSYL